MPNIRSDVWTYGTITNISPLQVQLDGEADPLAAGVASLVESGLWIGARVRIHLHNRQVIVVGVVNGQPQALLDAIAADIAKSGTTVYQLNTVPASATSGSIWEDTAYSPSLFYTCTVGYETGQGSVANWTQITDGNALALAEAAAVSETGPMPTSAKQGDLWHNDQQNPVLTYICTTAYASGFGNMSDWTLVDFAAQAIAATATVTATGAWTAAVSATGTALTAQQTATGASLTASQAHTAATGAQAAAGAATGLATTAQQTATAASATANTANITATAAQTTANTANVTATAARTAAATATGLATTAQQTATGAQATANTATGVATGAAATASAAQTAATGAVSTANAASAAATGAQATANTANATATAASANAAAALLAAQGATGTATTAQVAATAAAADAASKAVVKIALTAPSGVANVTWVDISTHPATFRTWDGTQWVATGDATAQTAAATATGLATTAQATATGAASQATTAQATATGAVNTANAAQTAAQSATGTAAAASTAAASATGQAVTALLAAESATGQASTATLTAITAQQTATGAANTAAAASTTAGNAATAAASATGTANTALTTANTATGLATTAQQTATGAVSTANAAQTAAQSATGTANTALAAAQSATGTASAASTTAGNAATAAASATGTANTALSAAQSATGTAGTALAAAQSATGTASAASTTAGNAATAAASATGTANTALSAAQSATGTASTASTNATNALTAAASATGTANTALTAAHSATGTAAAASTAAASATGTANTALAAAQSATGTASAASTAATNASTAAASATGTANTALAAAQSATGTAGAASTTATNALVAAQSATGTASAASTTAGNAATAAASATGTANTALAAAQSATGTASAASTAAASATGTANTALSAAQSATGTASAASTNATNAITAAASATGTANTALTAAHSATGTAAAASTAAASATGTANTALAAAQSATGTASAASTTAGNAATAAASATGTAASASTAAASATGLATTAQQTATGAVSTANNALSVAGNASAAVNFIRDPAFLTGADNLNSTVTYNASDPNGVNIPGPATTYAKIAGNDNWANNTKFNPIVGHQYRFECDVRLASTGSATGADFGLMVWYLRADGAPSNSYVMTTFTGSAAATGWEHASWTWTADAIHPTVHPALRASSNTWLVTNWKATDVTDATTALTAANTATGLATAAQTAAASATGTANTALAAAQSATGTAAAASTAAASATGTAGTASTNATNALAAAQSATGTAAAASTAAASATGQATSAVTTAKAATGTANTAQAAASAAQTAAASATGTAAAASTAAASATGQAASAVTTAKAATGTALTAQATATAAQTAAATATGLATTAQTAATAAQYDIDNLTIGSLGTGTFTAQFELAGSIVVNQDDGSLNSILIDPTDGIQVYGPEGASDPRVILPTDPSASNFFSGNIVANTLTVAGGATLEGDLNEVAAEGSLNLASGVSAPTNPPTITQDNFVESVAVPYPTGATPATPGVQPPMSSLWWDSVNSCWLFTPWYYTGVYSSLAGSLDASGDYLGTLNTAHPGLSGYGTANSGLYRFGGKLYAYSWSTVDALSGGQAVDVCTWYVAADSPATASWTSHRTATQAVGVPATDGATLYVAYLVTSKQVKICAYDTTNFTETTAQVINFTTAITSIDGLYVGNGDFGSKKWVLAVTFTTGAHSARVNAVGAIGATINDSPTDAFPLPTRGPVGYDGTHFWQLAVDSTALYRLESRFVNSVASEIVSFAYTWTSAASGGETDMSPAAAPTLLPRKRVTLSTPAFPANSAVDSINVYATTTLSPSRTQLYLQGSSNTNSWVMTPIGSIPTTGANPPAASTVPGAPAELRTEEGGFFLLGDGTGDWPVVTERISTLENEVSALNDYSTRYASWTGTFAGQPSVETAMGGWAADGTTINDNVAHMVSYSGGTWTFKEAGLYYLTYGITWQVVSASAALIMGRIHFVNTNGISWYTPGFMRQETSAITGNFTGEVSTITPAFAGDTFQCLVYQNNTAAQNFNVALKVVKLA